ncbi:MAG: glycosyltransferase family 39 protein [Anaerolineales bacterium]|nr:glycosyltransferase family 39 protein [Anaerolineales bacterium]
MIKLPRHTLLFLTILALGLALRIYQLGADDFWMDEIGVARAASAPSVADALKIAHNHIMAMPLDYVQVWGMGRISTDEGWLRLPAALWGALLLPAAFLLYRDQMGTRAALWGILLLAVSPMLIRYSQELRFYSSLVFFYTLSTAIGLKAARDNRVLLWAAFTLTTITGIFFHLYAALAFVNTAIYFVAQPTGGKRSLLPMAGSFLLIFTAALLSVVVFGVLNKDQFLLFQYETPLEVFGRGLGILPPFNAPPAAYLYSAVVLVLTLAGLLPFRKQAPLVISLIVQAGFILGVSAWRNYFASARQFLPLLPLVILCAARGTTRLVEKAKSIRWERMPAGFPETTAAILILAASFLVLIPYYKAEKTNLREVSAIMETSWQPGQKIMITPYANVLVYDYYTPWLTDDLEPVQLDEAAADLAGVEFVLSEADFDPGPGFEKLNHPEKSTFHPQIVWERKSR